MAYGKSVEWSGARLRPVYAGLLIRQWLQLTRHFQKRWICSRNIEKQQIWQKKLQFATLLTRYCVVSHIENSKN